jgi:energy-coupling factor transporter ATP-binding protein EcfA2
MDAFGEIVTEETRNEMSEAVKQEFLRWIRTLNIETLSCTQKKLLNIFITHFDTLKLMGTAGGRRAKKISELIQKQHDTLSETLPDLSDSQTTASDRVDRITELEIGPFRGFTIKEKFLFDKKYTFLYGPNGSGKSSFCEGLEYALLGDIEEASAKRIALPDYIRNTEKNTPTTPVAYTQVSGKKKPIPQNQTLYRFSFVEKNRIDGFARITAATAGAQKDRIATLFGLDAFSDFVDGFTNNFEQYLPLEPTKAKAFEVEKNKHEENTEKREQIEKSIEQSDAELQILIQTLEVPGITTLEEILHFLNGEDEVSGKINQLQRLKAEQIPADIDLESAGQLPIKIEEILSLLDALERDSAKLQVNSSEVNFKDLYSALTAIEDTTGINKSQCPACKTSLSRVATNPFTNAHNELVNLKSLAELQDRIPDKARSIASLVNSTITLLNTINDNAKKSGHQGQLIPSLSEVVYTEIIAISTWSQTLKQELEILQSQDTVINTIQTTIKSYNTDLVKKREQKNAIDREIRKYQGLYNRGVELTSKKKDLSEKKRIQKSLRAFTETNAKKIDEIATEKKLVEVLKKFCDAHIWLISNLKQYRDILPQNLSSGLCEKVVEYYNLINSHDPEFERLESLSLPSVAGDKINLRFIGEDTQKDALHVLSEGHIKVLGLSILLAKSVHEELGFLIFDDIVNAIDDDHRSGIVELLLTHPDFSEKQQIITCHGEQFINKLEHRLGASSTSKEVKRYRFYPVDAIGERGVKVSTGDAKHYLLQAKDAYEINALKDAASKCRLAIESIAETLWKKLGIEKNISLTVKMRAPGARPDLSTVVDSLIKVLKETDQESAAYVTFSSLKNKYPWSILNKGTHEQDNLPEFERTDIDSVLKLLETLEQEINKIKFATVISPGE